jgi:D-alanyl-D-alanine carboxypeptidase
MRLRNGLCLVFFFLSWTMSAVFLGSGFLPSDVCAEEKQTFPSEEIHALLDWGVKQGVPGVVLGIATPLGTWFSASGVADLKTQEPMSARHQIRLASITKPFTAVLVWSLIEQGILSLDDRVNDWLRPGLVPEGKVITIGMLLNHTSGLYDHENSPEFLDKLLTDPSHVWSNGEILRITRSHPMNFYPGTSYSYCNTEYYILGMIVEAATGKKVESLLKSRFFDPLGMTRTSVSRSGALTDPQTPGYCYFDGYDDPVSILKWNFSWDWTAGSGVSTAFDMIIWAEALSTGKVLKPETRERMWTVMAPSTMGYGFNVGTNASGFKWIGHGGLNQGTNTDWLFCPEKGWALFVGLNLSDYRTNPQVNTPAIIKTIRNGVERLLGWDAP